MARRINAKWSQEDLEKWEDELIELVYSNMLRQMRFVTVDVTVEERKEHEQTDKGGEWLD